MHINSVFGDPLIQDGFATLITFAIALSWLRLMDTLAHRGIIDQILSRKLVHLGTGPLFVLCWLLFSETAIARYWAALVPLAITGQFLAIGMQWIQAPEKVQAISRTGNPAELLRGPLYYGLAFTVCTICFWRHSPIGILALMMMCGGDGLADIVGRRLGTHKLPFSPTKSWAGSSAMFLGSTAFGWGFLALFNRLGQFQPALSSDGAIAIVTAIAAIATLVEALPFADIDNLTLTTVAIGLGLWWF